MTVAAVAQKCLAGCAIILSAGGFLALLWAFAKSRLPFNEEGRAFESGSMVVHHQQEVLGLASISGALLATAIVLLILRNRIKQAGQKPHHCAEEA